MAIIANSNRLMAYLSLIGNIASIAGILFAVYQILKIKSNSELTKIAIEETRHDIERIFSIADLTKSNEAIKLIQDSIATTKYEIALLRLQELKLMIIEFKEIPLLDVGDFKQRISDIIIKLGVDIISLHNCVISTDSRFRPEIVLEHLESTSEMLTEIKSKLKHSNYERR